MKVLFVYPNLTGQRFIQLGIAYLSAALKKANHQVELYDTTFGHDKKVLKQKIQEFNPDLIGFSARSMDFEFAVKIAEDVKQEFSIPIVFGGTHATIVPEEVIARKPVDIICIGEGEKALLELLSKMQKRENFENTESFWFKKKGRILKNSVRKLVQDLDSLPFPDRRLFDKRHLETESGMIFITGRGCPFQCSYCVNHKLHEIYENKGKFVRFRNVENVIEEIKQAKEEFNFDSIYFADETFTMGRQRIKQLCKALKEQVGLPFSAMTRADSVDKDILETLKQANCTRIHMGIETGNEKARFEILNRKMKTEAIIKAFNLARQVGLHADAFNMVGLPFETEETIMETIELNRLAKASGIQTTIFAPFKGTKLRELCEERGWLKEEPQGDYYTKSFLELPSISRAKVEAFQKTFWLYCYAPKILFPLIHALRFSLQVMPDSARSKLGAVFVRSGQVAGLIKKMGLRKTISQVRKKFKAS